VSAGDCSRDGPSKENLAVVTELFARPRLYRCEVPRRQVADAMMRARDRHGTVGGVRRLGVRRVGVRRIGVRRV
jgi:hypothetical protein